jgi:hypothetical protein
MAKWLKSRGVAGLHTPNDWQSLHSDLDVMAFPKRPTMEAGDRAAIYVVGSYRIPAVVEVVDGVILASDETMTSDPSRWPYAIRTRSLLLVPDLSLAPTLTDVGIDTLSVRSQSHIALNNEQYKRIVVGLAEAAGLEFRPVLALAA